MKSEYWPDDTSVPPSVAHKGGMNHIGAGSYPDGPVPWHAAKAPDLECGHNMYTQGRLRSCGYCGSMHPADLAAAIRAGARVSWADWKYGWPHKAYVEGVPNPHAGMRCSTTSTGYGSKKGEQDARTKEHIAAVGGEWVQLRSSMDREKKDEFASYPWHKVEAERATTHGKFYTVHLQDASPEDRALIEAHLGLSFAFEEGGRVSWRPAARSTGAAAPG